MSTVLLRHLIQTSLDSQGAYSGDSNADYCGKVRNLYFENDTIVFDHTDRLSAFDCAMGLLPYKGIILNHLSSWWWKTIEGLPHHFLDRLDDRRMRVKKVKPIALEVVVRGYLAGSMARRYEQGQRLFWGHQLPEGLSLGDKLPCPILTPTTKAAVYEHDEDILVDDIIQKGIATRLQWNTIQLLSLECFRQGSLVCSKSGLTLVDTKYEFGIDQGEVIFMDEIHTPDSSRFWQMNSNGEKTIYDKEILRSWLLSQGFHGSSSIVPTIPASILKSLVLRYLDVYEILSGSSLTVDFHNEDQIEQSI